MKYMQLTKRLMLMIVGSLLLLAPCAQAKDHLLGVIHAQKIFESVPQYEKIKQKLQNEFAKDELELRKMVEEDEQLRNEQQKKAGFISESDAFELQRRRKELSELHAFKQENMMQKKQRRHGEESVKLQEMIRTGVNKVAAAQGLDMVFDINTVAFVGQKVVDITQDVIREVSQMT